MYPNNTFTNGHKYITVIKALFKTHIKEKVLNLYGIHVYGDKMFYICLTLLNYEIRTKLSGTC